MMKTPNTKYIALKEDDIVKLKSQGCLARDWGKVRFSPTTDISLIHNVRFVGDVYIGELTDSTEREQGIYNAVIKDCRIGDNVYISNVGGELRGCVIGDRVVIQNVGRITFDKEASCGVCHPVGVLDETGSRPVYIFPGLTSQLAVLMALKPKWTEDVFFPLLQDYFYENPLPTVIGDDVVILDVMCIMNVSVGREVKLQGVHHMKNGAIINNAPKGRCLSYVGIGVDAENFIIEDAEVSTGATLRNCYVGQGVAIVKNFTAHDSLFFANSACENGEACAIIAGPYTVTMHKSSLLIGGQYSFMNAGSGTNASNHMYKLGPIHWGVMQRGVKTSSDAYMMWGGRIGAFSLLMGSHKRHPDTAHFPFSYLFANEKNETIVVPGIMLKSCGLKRDETKWPARDKRISYSLPMNDNICFDVLNPTTVSEMLKALSIFDEIELIGNNPNEYYTYNGLKIKHSSLLKGREIYRKAILKYLYDKTIDVDMSAYMPKDYEWIDLGGQIITRQSVDEILSKEVLKDIVELLKQSFDNYREQELQWIAYLINNGWSEYLSEGKEASEYIECMIEQDRKLSREMLSNHNNLLSL